MPQALLSDSGPLVRATAVQTIAAVVRRVQAFPPSEAALFEEYIMPASALQYNVHDGRNRCHVQFGIADVNLVFY